MDAALELDGLIVEMERLEGVVVLDFVVFEDEAVHRLGIESKVSKTLSVMRMAAGVPPWK